MTDRPERAADHRTALVLSGGGVRGAYEVGVVSGIVEVLGLRPEDPSPFQVFSGTSVGALNAAYLASHADRGDLSIRDLVRLWGTLRLSTHLRFHPSGLFRGPFGYFRGGRKDRTQVEERFGPSLLDARPFERIVKEHVPWNDLHSHIRRGIVQAFIIAALDLDTGVTTVFAETAPGLYFNPSRDPHRNARLEPVSANHVLASAAIPGVFPSRRIGRRYYCDGGLRFNTPMAPALRCGVDRLVVVSLLHETDPERRHSQNTDGRAAQYPGVVFLAGKLLNALLLDRITYDLYVLNRFNKLLDILHRTLTPAELARVDAMIAEQRGAPYKIVEPLVFAPTQDIGFLAGERVRGLLAEGGPVGRAFGWLLGKVAMPAQGPWEADWASYLLFDGPFCDRLIELGRADVRRRAAEVKAYFER